MGVALLGWLFRSISQRLSRRSPREAAPDGEASALTASALPREMRAPLAAFLSTSAVPAAIIGVELRLIAWNEPFLTLTGGSSGDLEHRCIADVLDERGHAWLTRQLQPRLGPNAGAQFGRVRMTVGTCADVLITGSPLLHRGQLVGWSLRFNGEPDLAFADPSMQSLVDSVKGNKERLAALLTVSHAVVNSLDLDIILATIAQEVRQVIDVDECTVFLMEADGQTLAPVVCDAERFREQMMRMRVRFGEGITGNVALTARGEIINSADGDPWADQVPGTPLEERSLMCVPMLAREKVLGVITLARLGVRSFDESDLELATFFAGQCSAALANARVYDELRQAYDELREAQAQLVQSAKLNALGEMAAGVAHDFNNILAAILGRTQIMLREFHDPTLRRQLLVVQQAALDGAQSVRRVQEFTRIRRGERYAGLDINTLLADVVELTRTAWETDAKRFGIVVRMQMQFAATRSVSGNASELREVFTNMILNAVDAMPQGGDLFVSSGDADEQVVIRVRDTGVGMDAQTRSRVFDPFFTTKTKGSGLGLSVAYGIVTRHGGAIEVESQPGAGTEFAVRFPSSDAPVPALPPPPSVSVPKKHVLVVDDEESVRSILEDVLRGLGQEVTIATGGREAIDLLDAAGPDIVFSDLGMPMVNGWDVAAAVRARRPETVMVLVTGWASQIDPDSLPARSVDMILGKPFMVEDVERALLNAEGALKSRPMAA